jgi:endoglucanase
MDSRTKYTRLVRDAAERRGMSWAYWDFAANFAVYDTPKHAYFQPILKALLGD